MDIIKKIIKGKEYGLADLKARKNIKTIQESLNNSLQLNKVIKREQDEDKKYVIDYDTSKTKLNLTSTTSTVLDNCDYFCNYGKDINIVYNKTDLKCYIYTDKLINAEFYYSEIFQGEQITQEDIDNATKFEITPDVISTIWFDGLHTFLNYNGKNLISEGYIKNSSTGVHEFLLVPMQQTTPVLQKEYIYKIRDTIYYKNNIWDPITQSLISFQGVPNSTDYWTDGNSIYTSVNNNLYVYEGNSWRNTEKILNFEIKNTDVWYCDGSTYISKENKTYLFDSFETVTFLNGDNFSSVDKIMYLDKTPFIKNNNGEIYSVKIISEVNLTPFKHEHKDYVSVNAQTLTEAQKQQVRTNIGASKDYGVFDGTNIGLVPASDNNNKKILLGDGTWGDSTTIVNSIVHEEAGAAAGTITINNIKTSIGAAIKSNTNNIATLEGSVVKTVNGQTPTSGNVVINATQIKLSNDASSKTIAEAISDAGNVDDVKLKGRNETTFASVVNNKVALLDLSGYLTEAIDMTLEDTDFDYIFKEE